jgi:hypothetical protein
MEFWSQVKDVGRSLSLISQTEAKKYGGMSDVSDKQAEAVRRDLCCSLLRLHFISVYCLSSSLNCINSFADFIFPHVQDDM